MINIKNSIINIRMNKIRKKKFKRFNKKVNRIININKNNSKYSETEKIALIKLDLEKFYSSKDIDKIKDYVLIDRIQEIKYNLPVFEAKAHSFADSLFMTLSIEAFISIERLSEDKPYIGLILAALIVFSVVFLYFLNKKNMPTKSDYITTEINQYELKLIKKELKKREANHKKVHQKENGKVKVTVKRIK